MASAFLLLQTHVSLSLLFYNNGRNYEIFNKIVYIHRHKIYTIRLTNRKQILTRVSNYYMYVEI